MAAQVGWSRRLLLHRVIYTLEGSAPVYMSTKAFKADIEQVLNEKKPWLNMGSRVLIRSPLPRMEGLAASTCST